MSEDPKAKLSAWLDSRQDALIADLQTLLRFPSIESDSEPNAPYGKANRDALDFMLGLSKKAGMTTTDAEGRYGFAEFGSGSKEVATFGHIDVVPVGDGWKYPPFSATLDNGYIYARGSCDDKGPTMASFYAMWAIKECFPNLNCRMRAFFGCDEESGFECIHAYAAKEAAPTYGIAPDAGWPLIHAEKGIANLIIHAPRFGSKMALQSFVGGQRPNIVIDQATAVVLVDESSKSGVLERISEGWDKNVSTSWTGHELTVTAVGKAAHGSTPFLGDSAATRVLRFLTEISPVEDKEEYRTMLETTNVGGQGLGIDGNDEPSKDLTCNLGIVETVGEEIKFTFNIRYPVTWKGADLKAKCLKGLPKGYRLDDFHDSPSLYFPLAHPLVKTVCDVYAEETGDTETKPGVMGGGTYARAIANTVAIGTGWMGDGSAHETNERIATESLRKMALIYALILYRLAVEA